MSMEDYDIQTMGEHLQSIMRIQDWDITILESTSDEMMTAGFACDNLGACMIDRLEKTAKVLINSDYRRHHLDGVWLNTLVHEHVHIVTDEIGFNIAFMLELIPVKTAEAIDVLMRDTIIERLVNQLTKIFITTLGEEEFLAKYRIKDEARDGQNTE